MGMTDMALHESASRGHGTERRSVGADPPGDLAPPRAQMVDVGRPRSGLARRRGAPADAFRRSLHDRHDRGHAC